MKRITSIVFALVLAVSLITVSEQKVQAAEVTITTAEGLIFSLNEADGTAILKDVSAPLSLTSITVPATITHETVTYSVNKIDYWAFSGCSKLGSITIPGSVTSIGEYAFNGCTSLKTIKIPDGVTKLYGNVFFGCSNLTKVSMPATMTSIGVGVFAGCVNLSSISVASENAYFSSENGILYSKDKKTLYAYPTAAGNYVIPSTVTTIHGSAFRGCSQLTNVTIPLSVTSMGSYAFADCTKLETVEIPGSVTLIESNAFTNCTSLDSITFPESVTTIGMYAFSGCANLTNLVIPSTVNKIQKNAFAECSSLQTIFYSADADYDIVFIGLSGVGCQFSYVENEDGTVTLTVESVADSMTSITLPDDIGGMKIVEVDGVDSLDIDIVCTDHIFKGYHSLTSGHKIVCKKCGIVDDSEEVHVFENEDEACICGYVPFSVSDANKTVALTEGYQETNTLTVTVTPTLGSETLTYQWYENDVEINGATAADYPIPTGKTVGTYIYSCKVSCGGYAKLVNVCVAEVSEKTDNPVNPSNPADDPRNPEDGQESVVPQKGSKIKDVKNLAWYKVTKAGTTSGKEGTVEYIKPVNKKKKKVSVPATITVDGIKYKVTGIASNAFKNNKYITKVTIGKYVKTIGAKAFYGCKKLKNITIKTTNLKLKKVGKSAFKGIESKATIKVPKSKYKAYKILLKKKGVGKKVKFMKL